MNWLFFALLAPAIHSAVSFTDKYIVEREVTNYRGMVIYSTIMGLVMGTLFWIVNGFPLLNLRDTAIVLLTGVLSVWSWVLYFKAISVEEASKLLIFLQVTPILTLLFSFLFLKEVITLKQCLGFVLIPSAILGVSKEKEAVHLSSSFLLILIVDVIWALSAVIMKFALEANSFSKILSYESWGIGIGGIILYLLFPSIRNAFNDSIKAVRKVALGVMLLNEGAFVLSKSITFFAYSLGSPALVSIIGSTDVFFGILYGWVLAAIAPTVFKEDGNTINLAKKVGFALLLFAGIWLIY